MKKELCSNLQRAGQLLELPFKTAHLCSRQIWRKQEDDFDVWFFVHLASFHSIFSLRKNTALPCVSTGSADWLSSITLCTYGLEGHSLLSTNMNKGC